ncbi:MAG: SpoIIIAC/SpoIIIAD family protein [Butyricicoccus sp.]
MDSALYLPVCKAVGVAVVVRITAALCRDAGQSALAAKMEIAGAVLTFSVCLPLFEQVLDLLQVGGMSKCKLALNAILVLSCCSCRSRMRL